MPSTIYATFPTEGDAERAAGALMDHGLSAEDISFVLPEQLPSLPARDAADSEGTARVHTPDAVPPPSIPITHDYALEDVTVPPPPPLPKLTVPRPHSPQEQEVGYPQRYHYDALGAVIPDEPPATTTTLPDPPRKTALPADTPMDTVEHDKRPHAHIVDMNRHLPSAAAGISTTTAADATRGALEGAGLGVGLGILLGLATVAIPGIGLVAGTGALVAGLAAATGAAGGIVGGVYGYLADLGLPPESARQLGERLQAGQVILSIHLAGNVPSDEIVTILRKYHATSAQAF